MNDEVRKDRVQDHEVMMDILVRLRELGVSPRSLTIGSVSIELSPEALIRDNPVMNNRRDPRVTPTSYVEKAIMNGVQAVPTTPTRPNMRRPR